MPSFSLSGQRKVMEQEVEEITFTDLMANGPTRFRNVAKPTFGNAYLDSHFVPAKHNHLAAEEPLPTPHALPETAVSPKTKPANSKTMMPSERHQPKDDSTILPQSNDTPTAVTTKTAKKRRDRKKATAATAAEETNQPPPASGAVPTIATDGTAAPLASPPSPLPPVSKSKKRRDRAKKKQLESPASQTTAAINDAALPLKKTRPDTLQKKVDKNIKAQPPQPDLSNKKSKDAKEAKKEKKPLAEDKGKTAAEKKIKQDKKPKADQEKGYIHPDDVIRPGGKRRARYDRYLAPEVLQKGLEDGSFYSGVLRINKRNRNDSYVTSDALAHDIYIFGSRDRNRALESDMVVVKLVEVDKIWGLKLAKEKDHQEKSNSNNKAPEPTLADPAVTPVNGDSSLSTDLALEIDAFNQEDLAASDQPTKDEDDRKPKYAGKVVGILERLEDQQYTGTLLRNRPGEGNDNATPFVWFKPTDKRVPLVAVHLKKAPEDFLADPASFAQDIYSVKLVRWPIDTQYPFGRVVSHVGKIGDVKVDEACILADNNILDAGFSKNALSCLPTTPWEIPNKQYKHRRDLRDYRVFSIDPATAKDLDDALHIIALDDHQFEVGVHIADVSYFVNRNTKLDAEARQRATSTYLVDRVIPMLPSLLCEQLCSLNPDVERLAFSVIWKMDDKGNIIDTWFGRTIIKSCAKLAYDDAQQVIDGHGLPAEAKVSDRSLVSAIEKDILALHKLSVHMRKRRFENGALSMNSIKLSFTLDDEGQPIKVWVYQLKEANRLIEEFMLRANMSVAEKICDTYPEEALLRRHEHPVERRMAEFIKTASELGYTIDDSSSGSLQASFDAIPSDDVRAVLRILAIKPMRRAKYFCTGTFENDDEYLHYALNVPMYTHFTSPIRRYADVMVHRLLESALLEKDQCGYNKKTMESVALHCNWKKNSAKDAQDQSSHLYLSMYLSRLAATTDKPLVYDAIVLQVGDRAFDLLVPEYGLEARVYADAMPIRRFTYGPGFIAVDWLQDEVMNGKTIDHWRSTNRDMPGVPLASPPLTAASQQDENTSLLTCPHDASTGTQQFMTFGRLKVSIEVSLDSLPTTIKIFIVNPFLPASN
ncbi:RNB-domain-containing protein [Hesseltinella vesiculosa]|uniref:DIS3-like exonuclease 2 n=1 Tax=Hesseltinella vesiculosa TaxID=101127 RepID=A0A1X2GIQ8_9FUNG|nr:RNB-domain-containing protein [Hesseltinella vesiculosa]